MLEFNLWHDVIPTTDNPIDYAELISRRHVGPFRQSHRYKMQHTIVHKGSGATYMAQLVEMAKWCEKHVGPQLENWCWNCTGWETLTGFRFMYHSDAVAFQAMFRSETQGYHSSWYGHDV